MHQGTVEALGGEAAGLLHTLPLVNRTHPLPPPPTRTAENPTRKECNLHVSCLLPSTCLEGLGATGCEWCLWCHRLRARVFCPAVEGPDGLPFLS